MRFRLRFYFILFVLPRLEFDTFSLSLSLRCFRFAPDRISQFLSQITCPELDLCGLQSGHYCGRNEYNNNDDGDTHNNNATKNA